VSSSIQRADLAADADVFLHVRADDDGRRAQRARLEHRHRRLHAEGARHIAGGGDHAAPAAADDQRFVVQRRIVPLLDRRIEGVAVDMRDRKRIEVGMTDDARRGAGAAARGAFRYVGEAIAAQSRHGGTVVASESRTVLPVILRKRAVGTDNREVRGRESSRRRRLGVKIDAR
jgi:hypothetical protein